MNRYIIEHRLHTLSQSYMDIKNGMPGFEVDGIKCTQWDFNFSEGHRTQFWLMEAKIEEQDFRTALATFHASVNPIVSKISMLSQCYTEILNEPYMVRRNDSDIALFRYTRESSGVPLAFDESSLKALEDLNSRQDINPEFYYYWNDMLNVTGYSAKLLLLCSALESLAKSPINQNEQKYDFLSGILGEELKDQIWKQKVGIRHRLMHGEYFNGITDKGSDYLRQAYAKIIEYFNNKVFENGLIRNVVNPQRHPDGNKEVGTYVLQLTNESPVFALKNLVEGCDEDFDLYLDKFNLLSMSEIQTGY